MVRGKTAYHAKHYPWVHERVSDATIYSVSFGKATQRHKNGVKHTNSNKTCDEQNHNKTSSFDARQLFTYRHDLKGLFASQRMHVNVNSKIYSEIQHCSLSACIASKKLLCTKCIHWHIVLLLELNHFLSSKTEGKNKHVLRNTRWKL